MENTKINRHQNELTTVDVEGKTAEEAIEKALLILKAGRKEVKVRILAEEQRGLFGMEGARPAKVRVALLKKKKLDRQG
jgi:spoIIIJ-associated protein